MIVDFWVMARSVTVMFVDVIDPELLVLVRKRIRRDRMLLNRQVASAEKTRADMHHAIRDALELGDTPASLACISGYTPQRVSQLRSIGD